MKQENTYHGPLSGLNMIDCEHYYAYSITALFADKKIINGIRIVRLGKPDYLANNFVSQSS